MYVIVGIWNYISWFLPLIFLADHEPYLRVHPFSSSKNRGILDIPCLTDTSKHEKTCLFMFDVLVSLEDWFFYFAPDFQDFGGRNLPQLPYLHSKPFSFHWNFFLGRNPAKIKKTPGFKGMLHFHTFAFFNGKNQKKNMALITGYSRWSLRIQSTHQPYHGYFPSPTGSLLPSVSPRKLLLQNGASNIISTNIYYNIFIQISYKCQKRYKHVFTHMFQYMYTSYSSSPTFTRFFPPPIRLMESQDTRLDGL